MVYQAMERLPDPMAVADDFGLHGGAVHDGGADLDRVLAVTGEKNPVERDGLARLDVEAGNPDPSSGLRPELLSASLEYRVHT